MWAKFCGWLLKRLGWTTDSGPVPENKAIILGVPHTSIMDGVISYLFYTQFASTKPKVMVKKEFFFWPVSILLRAVGGVPVDRSKPTQMMKSLIKQFKESETFVLAIAPEGTRKPVKRFKTGFHLIAKEVKCPVYLGYYDWGKKRISIGERFEVSDDVAEDIRKIQEHYKSLKLVGKTPENYILE